MFPRGVFHNKSQLSQFDYLCRSKSYCPNFMVEQCTSEWSICHSGKQKSNIDHTQSFLKTAHHTKNALRHHSEMAAMNLTLRFSFQSISPQLLKTPWLWTQGIYQVLGFTYMFAVLVPATDYGLVRVCNHIWGTKLLATLIRHKRTGLCFQKPAADVARNILKQKQQFS